MKHFFTITLFLISLTTAFGRMTNETEDTKPTNPVIWADVPDMAMVRVGDTYYMGSTTMHMSPGLPIMKSKIW